ncbi:MAG: ABC transporter permease, partial [Caldisericaceae bacterium]|nr:ABC transporter permease [Caldisericaceae bacterium]
MRKRYRSIIVFLILILSSVTILFTLVQYFSLENELQSYTYKAPISNFISISRFTMGNKSFLSADLEKMAKSYNKIDSIVLGIAEEMYVPPPNPERSGKTVEATLTDDEIKEIKRLEGIKAVYHFNVSKDEQFKWYTKVQDKNINASPVPADFLNALHPSLAYGRYFNESDGQRVCMLSNSMNRALFGTVNSVGRTITVYESGKQAKYKVIGILSSENEDPKYIIALPFITMYGFLIPYDPNTELINSNIIDNFSLDKFNNLFIIPREGKYNYLMKKIKEVLGEDYPYLVSSLPNLMKYTLGAQIRYNRIKTLALVSILTIIAALFTLIE